MTEITKNKLLLLNEFKIKHDKDNCFVAYLPKIIPLGDSPANQVNSKIHLFENETEIGPAHTIHSKIRSAGSGAYSHWEDKLYFSSTDNSSPLKNKRTYHILVPTVKTSEADSMVENIIDGYDIENISFSGRYELAKNMFKKIWGDCILPDWGRTIERDKQFRDNFNLVSPESTLSIERKYNLRELLKLSTNVSGDIAECGTYKGASAYFMAKHIIDNDLKKSLYLFDSFKGLSKPGDMDGEYWEDSEMSSGTETLKTHLSTLQITEFITIMDGWIPTRFYEVNDRKFSFVHIDVDLYQPTKDSIEFFYPLVSAGGLMVFDDYGFETCPGATKSIEEFMASKPEPIINMASGGAYIIKIN